MEVPILVQESAQVTRKQIVRFLVEERTTEQSLSQGKRLHVLLTDPSDPFFLFSLVLTDSDFQVLKRQQGLLVDFCSFASTVNQLAQKCVDEARTNAEAPKFNLLLDCCNSTSAGGGSSSSSSSSSAVLNFQEINDFRHLCHLSLKVCRGSDAQVKEYLAECITRMQESASSLNSRLSSAESDLRTAQARLREKEEEIAKVRRSAEDQSSAFESRLAGETAREKERSAQTLVDAQTRYDSERRQVVEGHARTTRQMENRIASLDYENKDLTERRHRNEAAVQRLGEQLRQAQEEGARLRKDLAARERMDGETGQRERAAGQVRERLAQAEQENARLTAETARLREINATVHEQKVLLEREVGEKAALVKRREDVVRSVSQELVKANEIIRKYQDQVKTEHGKFKQGVKALEEQERLVAGKDSELSAVREELRIRDESLAEIRSARTELESTCKRLRDEVGDLEKRLRTNETVIHWLNRQLTTAQARDPGLRLGPPPEGIATTPFLFTPSGMAASSTPLTATTTEATTTMASRPHTMGRSGNSHGTGHGTHDESVMLRPSAATSSKAARRSGEKENTPAGLDEKYLQPTTANAQQDKGLLQPPRRGMSVLPSNIQRGGGGLLRKQPPAAASARGGSNSRGTNNHPLLNSPAVDSVYFPRT